MSDWKFSTDCNSEFVQNFLQNGLNIADIAKECKECAVAHGFPLHEKLPQLVAFMGEVGEWCEAVRKGDLHNELEEVVDIIVRIFAYAQEHHTEVWTKALLQKMEFNRGRERLHGKLF